MSKEFTVILALILIAPLLIALIGGLGGPYEKIDQLEQENDQLQQKNQSLKEELAGYHAEIDTYWHDINRMERERMSDGM